MIFTNVESFLLFVYEVLTLYLEGPGPTKASSNYNALFYFPILVEIIQK